MFCMSRFGDLVKGFDRHKPTRTGQHRAGTPISGKEAVYQTVTGQRQTSAETLAAWGRDYQPIDLMYSVLHRLWDFRDYGIHIECIPSESGIPFRRRD